MSSTSIATAPAHAGERQWYDSTLLRVVALAATLTVAAAYQAVRLFALTDNDIWWHLRTGLWMLQNHAIPRSGLFSQSASLAWIDASWGFDLLSAAAYRLFGLSGLPIFLMLLQVAGAAALFLLSRVACRRFWPAVILTAIAQGCVAPLQPRPALCSIAFLSLELAVLLHARRTSNARPLYWLPLLFALWVNFDQQFSYGLAVLVLFCAAAVIEELCRRSGIAWLELPERAVRLAPLGIVAIASFLATFLSPYGWHLHELVWRGVMDSAADRYFRQLHAMRFRQPEDYLLMLLLMAAFFGLGRRRSRDVFLTSLLLISMMISFRFVRDNWLVVVVSVGVLGSALYKGEAAETSTATLHNRRLVKLLTVAVIAIVVSVVAARLPSAPSLMSRITENFPVQAGDYIRQNHLSQPLFNTYSWGGFLTWYLPEYPVSIDGRIDLYGDEMNISYFRLMQAEIPLESDPGFARAQTILLDANSPIAQALSTLPAFRVAYRDNLAMVLVRTN